MIWPYGQDSIPLIGASHTGYESRLQEVVRIVLARIVPTGEPPEASLIIRSVEGAGIQKAMDNTAALAESWLEKYSKTHEITDVSVPAIYTAKTETAVKVARTLNAQAGYNKVLDVRRDGRHWEVDLKPSREWTRGDAEPVKTEHYASLRALREAIKPSNPAPALPSSAQLQFQLAI